MKTDKELATEIVIAAINADVKKPHKTTESATVPFTTEDIAPLLKEIYSALRSFNDSISE